MKQAIVVIHGIGEQRPLATIRQFVSAITDGPARSKPDRLSESFELRRFSLVQTRSMPPTDVYELYWAHHMTGARWSSALHWIAKLIFHRNSSLPRGLRAVHRALWLVILMSVTGTLYSAKAAFGSTGGGLQGFLSSAITYTPAVAFLAQWLFGRIVLGYIGDAARYLTPEPENIEARTKIRAEGVALLRRLHTSQTYSRVVLVGHSLGSVIGYDILCRLWDEMRKPEFLMPIPQPEAQSFKAATASVNNPPAGTSQAAAVNEYQQAQHRLWREQRILRTPWLITDFVTLGSPLAHAALLLEDPLITMDQRKLERELPTCPPTSGEDEAHYLERHDIKVAQGPTKWDFRIPHHAAVFCCTRWTNLYFPYRRLILGDMIGGPLADVFGYGIRDVAVRPNLASIWSRTLISHIMYWRMELGGRSTKDRAAQKEKSKITRTSDVILALRSALQLEAKRAKEPWPDP